MTSRAIPLQDLEHRINQHQDELAMLRQEYEARQNHLRELTQRKEKLQTQLQELEAEIHGVGQGSSPTPPAPIQVTASKPVAKPAPAEAAKKSNGTVSLPQLLIRIVAKAGGPITVKEIARAVVRHKYPSTSQNLPKMVEKRVSEMVKKGFFKRAPNQQGVLPAQAPESTKAPAAKPASVPVVAAPKPETAKAPTAKPASTPAVAAPKAAPVATAPTPAPAGDNQPPLPEVVTQVLAKTTEPLSARALAEKVLATGYKSKSKDFINVIWAGVGKMDNVENVQGKGYRLKKTTAAAPPSKAKGSK